MAFTGRVLGRLGRPNFMLVASGTFVGPWTRTRCCGYHIPGSLGHGARQSEEECISTSSNELSVSAYYARKPGRIVASSHISGSSAEW